MIFFRIKQCVFDLITLLDLVPLIARDFRCLLSYGELVLAVQIFCSTRSRIYSGALVKIIRYFSRKHPLTQRTNEIQVFGKFFLHQINCLVLNLVGNLPFSMVRKFVGGGDATRRAK